MEYYLLTSQGREGPYQEAELLDLLEAGEVSPEEFCQQCPSGEQRALGDWFEVLEPNQAEDSAPPVKAGPRPPSSGMVQWEGRPSLWARWPHLAIAGGALWLGQHYERLLPGIWLAGLWTATVIVVFILVGISRWQYKVTRQTVEVLRGWWFKDSCALRLEEITAIRVRHPGLAGLCGVGEVEFAAGDGPASAVVFWGLRSPRQIKELVEACAERMRVTK